MKTLYVFFFFYHIMLVKIKKTLDKTTLCWYKLKAKENEMYIKNTGFGYGVFRNGNLVAEFATYDEAYFFIKVGTNEN